MYFKLLFRLLVQENQEIYTTNANQYKNFNGLYT